MCTSLGFLFLSKFPLLRKTPVSLEQGPPYDFFSTNHFFKDPTCKYNHILGCWGSGLQYMNFGGDHSARNSWGWGYNRCHWLMLTRGYDGFPKALYCYLTSSPPWLDCGPWSCDHPDWCPDTAPTALRPLSVLPPFSPGLPWAQWCMHFWHFFILHGFSVRQPTLQLFLVIENVLGVQVSWMT